VAIRPRVLQRPSLQEIREAIESDAYWMAHALYERDPHLNSITVYVVGDPSFLGVPSGSEYLFVATLARANLAMDPDLRPPTPLDLAAFYKEPWWIRGLEP
jgi:hypothetical protein